jgi:hypothetical protein
MKYLYRVIDREGDAYAYLHMDDAFPIREVYETSHDADYIKIEAEHRSINNGDGRGPWRILRVPVSAWEEVK